MTTELTARDLDLSREKIDLIKQTVAKGATDLELELFFHACRRTGLDPLMKQIYAIKRWNAQENRMMLSIQTGIDGYRLIADRTGQYAGSSDVEFSESEDGLPRVAKVTVTKLMQGVPCQFSASARWSEYCQVGKDGQPTSMWRKMPFLMLGKCAEALALRKAFPAELSGLYTHEEMAQADNPTKTKDVEPDGGVPPTPAGHTAQQGPDAAPPPREIDLREPALEAGAVARMFRECENIAAWSHIANNWLEESDLHSDEDRAMVKAAADAAKARLGKQT